jgi:hypothetical protein
MANGEGNRLGDRRFHGRGDNAQHTVSKKKNDQVGDKRHLKKKMEGPSSDSGRSVPIAATVGGPTLPKADNGGGKRIAPSSMIKAGM